MRHLLTIFLTLFSVFCFSQEKITTPPQLVVGIKVDGLKADHLQKLWYYFSPDGFRKIVSESLFIENLQNPIAPSGNSATMATLFTGSYPYYHGITDDRFYSRNENRTISIIEDTNQIGIGTTDKFSARRLQTSTVVDELLLYNKKSQVHVVAIEPIDAIMMGGHTATYVTWIDEQKEKFVTSSYYEKGLSKWADLMNTNGSFRKYTSEIWTPSATISTYINPTLLGSTTIPFKYETSNKNNGNIKSIPFKRSPNINSLVTDLAKLVFEKENLGTDKNPDIVLLQYNVIPFGQYSSSFNSAEQEDLYLRLDRNLQSLLSIIQAKIGLDNVLLFLMGDESNNYSPIDLSNKQISAGFFNADRSLALLNTYLMAIYGQEKWISGYYGKNIYLNKKKIEEKKIDLREISSYVANFIVEFEGVQSAYTAEFINHFAGDNLYDERAKIRHSYHKERSGDVIITLKTGWLEVDNQGKIINSANSVNSFIPFYLMGKGISHTNFSDNVSTIDIAPTLSKILQIPNPNGAIGKSIKY